MSNLKLLSKILRLKGMKITHFEFKNRDKELHLTVKPHKNGCRCPECGRLGAGYDAARLCRGLCALNSRIHVVRPWRPLRPGVDTPSWSAAPVIV